MNVYYGFSFLTPKAVKKRELAIYFENEFSFKNEEWVKKRLNVVYVRKQTKQEAEDGETANRMFTKFRYFIDDKPFCGDIDKVLDENSQADNKNVSAQEREEIKTLLKQAYFKHFSTKEI